MRLTNRVYDEQTGSYTSHEQYDERRAGQVFKTCLASDNHWRNKNCSPKQMLIGPGHSLDTGGGFKATMGFGATSVGTAVVAGTHFFFFSFAGFSAFSTFSDFSGFSAILVICTTRRSRRDANFLSGGRGTSNFFATGVTVQIFFFATVVTAHRISSCCKNTQFSCGANLKMLQWCTRCTKYEYALGLLHAPYGKRCLQLRRMTIPRSPSSEEGGEGVLLKLFNKNFVVRIGLAARIGRAGVLGLRKAATASSMEGPSGFISCFQCFALIPNNFLRYFQTKWFFLS